MHIFICCDTFKSSLSSGEISSIISHNIQRKFPKAKIYKISMADGGEGSLDALLSTKTYREIRHDGLDALLKPIQSKYLISHNGKQAVLELAQTCGLAQIKPCERDCLQTTTYGLGLQIKEALANGVQSIDLLIGGSATNDLGIGMAAALGYKFYNQGKRIQNPKGKDMVSVSKIDKVDSIVIDIKFRVICDVKNVLLGEQGAAYMYGKQKGASEEGLKILEAGAENIIKLANSNKEYHLKEGSGAAGGVGWGAMNFLNAQFYSGVDYLIDKLEIDNAIKDADLIITGEGRIDKQTLHGKLVEGLSRRALRNKKKVIAICALNELNEDESKSIGLSKVYSMYNTPPDVISKDDTITRLKNICDSIVSEYLASST